MKKVWPFIVIFAFVIFFFWPTLKGLVPFPGDLLVNQNPYSAQSFLGFSAGGYPNKAQGPDVIHQIYPWKFFSITQLKNLSFPFWNPYNFSGNPQMANFQTAIFYPFNLIYFLLPFNLAWTIFIMLQPLIAAIFMYLFLKKGLQISNFPSIIGALSFAFSSYMSVWMEYGNIGSTFMWLPLVLLFTKYFYKKLNVYNVVGISTALFLAILAGYIQGAFYIYILCFLYYIYLTYSSRALNVRNFLIFTLCLLLPFIVASFQILPTIQLFLSSTRGAYTLSQIEHNLSPIFNLITIAIPDFFGNPATRNYWIDGTYIERVMYPGSLIFFFAIYALFTKSKFSEKRFFAIVAAVSLFIATNFPLVKYFYLIPIPVISTTVATRELSIFIFSAIVLGVMGLETFLKKENTHKRPFFIIVGIYILLWFIVLVAYFFNPTLSLNLKISIRNMILPTFLAACASFLIILKRINKNITLFFIFFLVVVDLFYFFHKITPFSPQELIYPDSPLISYMQKNAGINRFWGYGSGYIAANFQSVDKTFSPEGNDPLHISRYTQLLASSENGKLPKVLPRPDANIAPGFGTNDLKDNLFRKRLLDLLGVKYIVNRQDMVQEWGKADFSTFPKEQYNLIEKMYPFQVYKNNSSLPRFFLAGKYKIAKDKTQALAFVYSKDINLRETLILEDKPTLFIDPNSKNNVSISDYKPNRIIFNTQSSGNSLLFLSDNFYPEWEAKIDGVKARVLVADYSFRAVEVPKGKHKVTFYYNPKSFMHGTFISIIGVTFFLLLLLYVKRNFKKI